MTKHTACVITFQKNNGDIIMRPRLSCRELNIGDITSMGWKVLDIHYEYNGNYYHEQDYSRLLRKNKKKYKQKMASLIIRKVNTWR